MHMERANSPETGSLKPEFPIRNVDREECMRCLGWHWSARCCDVSSGGQTPAAQPGPSAQPTPARRRGLLAAASNQRPGQARLHSQAAPRCHRRRRAAFALLTGVFIASYTVWESMRVATPWPHPSRGGGLGCDPRSRRGAGPDRAAGQDAADCGVAELPAAGARRGGAVPAGLHPGADRAAVHRDQRGCTVPEVSVLFGVLLGGRLLGEGSRTRRLAAAVAIVAGIISVAIG